MSFAASTAQRRKVRFSLCAFCGRGPGCDPAHVTPRSLGGCDHPDCVIPACRDCHRQLDKGEFDALPALEALYRTELAHAVLHMGLERLRNRLIGQGAASP